VSATARRLIEIAISDRAAFKRAICRRQLINGFQLALFWSTKKFLSDAAVSTCLATPDAWVDRLSRKQLSA
jgi:hypothetical protein